MTIGPPFDSRFAGPPGMLAANTDRDRVIDVLKAGFAEGRLSKTEYDDRAARVYAARTYGELGSLVADLPAGPLAGPPQYPVAGYLPPPAVNSTAVAALTCGIAVFLTMGLTAIPAIVLGHSARRQVRATGQRGDGMSLAGMVLGWVGVAFLAVAVAGLVAVSVTGRSSRPVVVNPVVVKPVPANPGGPLKPAIPVGNPANGLPG